MSHLKDISASSGRLETYRPKDISILDVDELARYARLFRSDEKYQFSSNTKLYLKKILLSKFNIEPSKKVEQISVPTKFENEPVTVKSERSLKELQVELRALVEASSPWESIKEVSLEIWRLSRDPQFAAFSCELALLHAPAHQMAEFVGRIASEGLEFYGLVHEKVRQQLCLTLWEQKKLKLVARLVYSLRKEELRLPIEHLFVFLNFVASASKDEAFIYFQRQEIKLVSALGVAHESKVYSIDRFYYTAGQLAVEAGFVDSARRLLENIDPKSPEYSGALQLLLNLNLPVNQRGYKKLTTEIDAQRNWGNKLSLISGYLYETRRLGGIHDKNRPALNAIFTDPFKYVPSSSDAWQAVCELVLLNLDLVSILPNLPKVFFTNATKFHPRKLDLAIWKTANDSVNLGGSKLGRLIKGIAEIHLYAHAGPVAEEGLWRCKKLVEAVQVNVESGCDLSYKTLLRATMSFVRKSPALVEKKRESMLRQMSISLDPDSVLMSDIYEYIRHSEVVPYKLYEYLQSMIQKKNDYKTEKYLIEKKVSETHYKNCDMERMFEIALKTNDVDLGWRVVTLLKSRESLAPVVEQSWKISGERRSEYPICIPSESTLELLFAGMDPAEVKFAQACIGIGPLIPEFLSYLDRGSRVAKATKPDRISRTIDQALKNTSWLTVPAKTYRFSVESPGFDNLHIPVFAEMMPNNQWCRVVSRLNEVLGVYAWGYRMSALRSHLDLMLPQPGPKIHDQFLSYKASKWIKSLTPLQRKCWKDLVYSRDELSDENIMMAISKVIMRLATVIYPAHYQALTSLKKMRVPVEVYWDLERWILSSGYDALREEKSLKTRVLIPAGVRGMRSIIKTDKKI